MIDLATKNVLPISVVIATLGGDVLKSTIAHLNQGDAVPSEILICIPEALSANAECVAMITNVHIIKTPCRGQVSQRAFGLGMASYAYVMQFDDDVIIPPGTLEALLEALLSKGIGNVVAPFFRIYPSGEECTQSAKGFSGFLRNWHASLVCGAPYGDERFGKISSSGIGFGILMTSNTQRVVESEWLPGGVSLCHKVDLIAYDYYPFQGKAFSEDLIHSILWRRQGCRLWTVLDAYAMIHVTIESFDWKSIMGRYRAHAYVAEMLGGNIWQTRLWLACYCFLNAWQFLVKNFLKRQ